MNVLYQFKDLIGWIATFFSLLFIISPIKEFIIVYKKGNTDDLETGFPYSTSLYNALLWVVYQQHKAYDYIPALTINTVAVCLMGIYCVMYCVFASTIYRKKFLIEFVCLSIYSIVGISMISIDIIILGYFAMGMNLLLCYSPLIVILNGIDGIKKVPRTLIFLLFMCTFLWLLYGISHESFQVIIPNSIGLLLSVIQIILKVYFECDP